MNRRRTLILLVLGSSLFAVAAIGKGDITADNRISSAGHSAAHQAPYYSLKWWSINDGSFAQVESATYKLGLTVAQAAEGKVASANYKMGVGFWHGMADHCQVQRTGDVNMNGEHTTSDIIYLVNYVFRAGPDPLPCAATGDVNCNGSITGGDIIYLVGYVLRAGPPPCDICTLIPGTWTCP